MSIWDKERAHIVERYEGPARAAGLGAVWDQAASEKNATSTLTLGLIGAVACYMAESGLTVEEPLRSSA